MKNRRTRGLIDVHGVIFNVRLLIQLILLVRFGVFVRIEDVSSDGIGKYPKAIKHLDTVRDWVYQNEKMGKYMPFHLFAPAVLKRLLRWNIELDLLTSGKLVSADIANRCLQRRKIKLTVKSVGENRECKSSMEVDWDFVIEDSLEKLKDINAKRKFLFTTPRNKNAQVPDSITRVHGWIHFLFLIRKLRRQLV